MLPLDIFFSVMVVDILVVDKVFLVRVVSKLRFARCFLRVMFFFKIISELCNDSCFLGVSIAKRRVHVICDAIEAHGLILSNAEQTVYILQNSQRYMQIQFDISLVLMGYSSLLITSSYLIVQLFLQCFFFSF